MADRDDPSQYLTDQGNENDQTYFGDVAMNNHQIQSRPEGVYVDAEELVGYENVGVQDDYLTRNPGKYNTKVIGEYSVAVPRTIPGASGPILTAPCHISGWGIRETSGVSSALVRLRDGADLGSSAILTIALAPGESARDFLTLPIVTTRALYLEIATGTVEGNVYTVEKRYV